MLGLGKKKTTAGKQSKPAGIHDSHNMFWNELLFSLSFDHCMERGNRKCGWFWSPAILLSGVSNCLHSYTKM